MIKTTKAPLKNMTSVKRGRYTWVPDHVWTIPYSLHIKSKLNISGDGHSKQVRSWLWRPLVKKEIVINKWSQPIHTNELQYQSSTFVYFFYNFVYEWLNWMLMMIKLQTGAMASCQQICFLLALLLCLTWTMYKTFMLPTTWFLFQKI